MARDGHGVDVTLNRIVEAVEARWEFERSLCDLAQASHVDRKKGGDKHKNRDMHAQVRTRGDKIWKNHPLLSVKSVSELIAKHVNLSARQIRRILKGRRPSAVMTKGKKVGHR
jgi:hypothetical protein